MMQRLRHNTATGRRSHFVFADESGDMGCARGEACRTRSWLRRPVEVWMIEQVLLRNLVETGCAYGEACRSVSAPVIGTFWRRPNFDLLIWSALSFDLKR